MDAEIELRRDEKLDTRSWRSSKLKDEKDGTGYGFRLVQHQLGFDADGDPETSCTVEREVFVHQNPRRAVRLKTCLPRDKDPDFKV